VSSKELIGLLLFIRHILTCKLSWLFDIYPDSSADASENGCCGGFPGDIFLTVKNFTLEADYPYELYNWKNSSQCAPEECRSSGKETALEIRGFDKFRPFSGAELKKQIWMYGPMSVFIEYPDAFNYYRSGVFDCTGMGHGSSHYVTAVGFGPNYFVLRNSWGPDWGLEGDFLLSDKDIDSSCQMLGPSVYYQMVRVSVKTVNPSPSPSESVGFRTLPILSFAFLFLVICLQWL